jgi:hypothetical protein
MTTLIGLIEYLTTNATLPIVEVLGETLIGGDISQAES